MSSVLPQSNSQTKPVPPHQLPKPMHPQQTTPVTYGQPSNHHPPSFVNMPLSAAHSHPPPSNMHQSNHYLNVPNAPQHYGIGGHPPNVAQQMYGGQKNIPMSGGYQPSFGHPPNVQNTLPPVSQALHATNLQVAQPSAADQNPEKPQSNGTGDSQSEPNHVTVPKETPAAPATPTPAEAPSEVPNKASASPEKPETAQASSTKDDIAKPPPPSNKSAGDVAEAAEQTLAEGADKPASPAPSATSFASAAQDTANEGDKTDTAEVASVEKPTDGDNSKKMLEENEKKPTEKNGEENLQAAIDKAKESPSKTRVVATPPRVQRKAKTTPKSEADSPKTVKPEPLSRSPSVKQSTSGGISGRVKRKRIRTQPYQCPLPEQELISKISAKISAATSSSLRIRNNNDKLIVFYKNEFLAVRNSEGSFYICQAVQNIYKSSGKIRIRWLSQDKGDKTSNLYTPDFYDNTDFDCILTNLNLEKVGKGKFRLPQSEKERTDSILKRSIAAEKGEELPETDVTEGHPDGVDLSLYKGETQVPRKKRGPKRKASTSFGETDEQPRASTSRTPDKRKVARVTPKTTKSATTQNRAQATPKKIGSEKAKASTSSSRSDRVKRRPETPKVSPKVDSKKAKVLAKVARNAAISLTPKPQQPTLVQMPAKSKKTPKPKSTPASPKSSSKTTPTIPIPRTSLRRNLKK